MYKILVCCSAGFTANRLVASMKKEAESLEKRVMIWTAAKTAVAHSVAEADCILIAPQIASAIDEIRALVKDRIPVVLIDTQDFSSMNGKAVLHRAISLIDA